MIDRPYTKEYGTFPENELSKRTVLATGKGAFGRLFELIHKSEGYECAGSCARLTSEAWGSLSYGRSGTTHGQWFKTLQEAKACFEQYTTPIVEVRA